MTRRQKIAQAICILAALIVYLHVKDTTGANVVPAIVSFGCAEWIFWLLTKFDVI